MKASEHGGSVPASVGAWFWNARDDGEVWADGPFDTKEGAAAEGQNYANDSGCLGYVGVGVEVSFPGLDADRVIEELCEQVYEKCGEASEHWLGHVPKEAKEELENELNAAISRWLTKHGEWPRFCCIDKIEKVEAEGADGQHPVG